MSETIPGAVYDKRKSRRGYVTLPAVDPHIGGLWDVLLSEERMRHIARQGRGPALELGYTVPWTLKHPRHVFRGIRDDDREIDDDGWLCYVGLPATAYDWKRAVEVPAWEKQVFLVYVNDERIIYHSAWYDCDPVNILLPVDHQLRFKQQVF